MFDLESREFFVSRDVIFHEKIFPYIDNVEQHSSTNEEIDVHYYSDDEDKFLGDKLQQGQQATKEQNAGASTTLQQEQCSLKEVMHKAGEALQRALGEA